MKILKVIDELLKRAPDELQFDYDNGGLQTGDTGQPLKNVLVTLDVDSEAINKAVKKDANLIVSHHPLIFRPMKKIDAGDITGKKIINAIKNNISIFSIHTNFDFAYGGLNDVLGARLGIENLTPLIKHEYANLCKLVVFIPAGYEAKVKKALFKIGAGSIGNYSNCSFSQEGEGTFTAPLESNPFIGKKGSDNLVSETRLETVVPKRLLDKAVDAIRSAHPYEEPAYDIYPLIIKGIYAGIGRIGDLKSRISLSEFCKVVKDRLKVGNLRYTGNSSAKIKRVAVCSGSGGSLINDAKRMGADVYVTGDIKYHEAKQAEDLGLNVIDAGHFSTEIIFVDHIKKHLSEFLKYEGCGSKVFTYKSKDPVKIIK